MQKITPFLWFEKNNSEEAMNFYVSVFKNSKIVTIKRYPEGITEGPMAGMGGKVLTGVFELDGQQFMCLDGGPNVFQFSGAISFLVRCKDQEEIDYFWEKLSAVKAAEQCGWCTDQFGVTWQIVPQDMEQLLTGPDAAGSARAMQAMMQMKKIDIAELKRAYDQA
ncbi:MAG: VOC family protein [Patescibacteria group bacterium]